LPLVTLNPNGTVSLPRFRGHFILEGGGTHDAKIKTSVPCRSPTASGPPMNGPEGASPVYRRDPPARPDRGGAPMRRWWNFQLDLVIGQGPRSRTLCIELPVSPWSEPPTDADLITPPLSGAPWHRSRARLLRHGGAHSRPVDELRRQCVVQCRTGHKRPVGTSKNSTVQQPRQPVHLWRHAEAHRPHRPAHLRPAGRQGPDDDRAGGVARLTPPVVSPAQEIRYCAEVEFHPLQENG